MHRAFSSKPFHVMIFLLLFCQGKTLFAEDIKHLNAAFAPQNEERKGGIVLVLSGGGTKGIAHVGVLKMLEREKIPIAGIVGTSMGAVIGGLYASGYSADELRRIILETNIMGLLADSGTRIRPDSGNHRPLGESVPIYQKNFNKKLRMIGPLGILPARSLTNFLIKYTGEVKTTDFDHLPIPFACVATNLRSGEAVVLRDGNLASALRASASIPGLMELWPIGGNLLVDGGLVANLPVGVAKEIFPGYPIVAVNLAGETIAKSDESFKNVVDVLSQTIDIMTQDRLKQDEAQADLIIYPVLHGFSMLDSSGYEKIYQRGFEAAEAQSEAIVALSRKAAPAPRKYDKENDFRIVKRIRVVGLHERMANDLEKAYRGWIGHRYDMEKVNQALERMSKMEEVETVDVDTYPIASDDERNIEVVFSLEKRAPFEILADGYTSNLHSHRWMAVMMNARDLALAGDSAYFEGRLGDNEWGAVTRYFTPLLDQNQWGFSLGARKDRYSPHGIGTYSVERYSTRAMYYREHEKYRLGFGLAGEHTNAENNDDFTWGPYLYFNVDTLDNLLAPTKGLSFNSQVWWNTENIFVSRTNLTAYIPLKSDLHFILNFGLETGDKDNQAYRALLGDQEELFSLAAHPYMGDQAAWTRLGVGREFYRAWWGSLRGEFFAAYGLVMDGWNKTRDAWETGIAISVPGQFINSKILLIYDDGGELTLGFSLGIPRWWGSPLP